MHMKYNVVVPAAGVGKRMQASKPKQYLMLGDKTVLETTLEQLISHPSIDHVYLVLNPNDPYFPNSQLHGATWLTCIDGGEERVNSVLNGLRQVTSSWVLVHDAARPCVSHQDIDNLLALQRGGSGGLLAHRVRDTMKISNSDQEVTQTPNRDNLWHAMTPQFFPTQQLIQAITGALAVGHTITDEASAMEWAGKTVNLVAGRQNNIKITTPDDISLASYYLQHQQERITT